VGPLGRLFGCWGASGPTPEPTAAKPTPPHPLTPQTPPKTLPPSLAGALATRLPNLVDLLHPDFDDSTALRLRHAYAECLVAGVREAQEEAEEAAAGEGPWGRMGEGHEGGVEGGAGGGGGGGGGGGCGALRGVCALGWNKGRRAGARGRFGGASGAPPPPLFPNPTPLYSWGSAEAKPPL
jgi:hypothetical protein